MWNPLQYLPASNAGALAAYSPSAAQQPVQQAPVAGQTPLHPLYGRHGGPNTQFPLNPMAGGSNAGGMADPAAFHSAMQAWRADAPDKLDARALMADWTAAGAQGQFRDYMQPLRQDWQQGKIDWRQARPMRSGY